MQALAEQSSGEFQSKLQSLSAAGEDALRQAEQAKAMIQEEIAKATAIAEAARGQLEQKRSELTAMASELQRGIEERQAAIAKARSDGEAALEAAKRRADQLRAAGLASAMSQVDRDAVAQQAQKVVDDAQTAADDAVRQAEDKLTEFQGELETKRQALEAEANALTSAANQRAAEVQQRLDDEVNAIAQKAQQLAADAQQLVAGAAGLPANAVALAEDARREIAALFEPNASLLGLLTRALVFLKDTYFGEETRLQVVAFTPTPNATPGIGLSWVDGQVKLLLAYSPDSPGPRGSIVVNAAGASGSPIQIGGGTPVTLTIAGAGSQDTVISFESGATAAADSNLDVSLELSADTSSLAWSTDFGHASPGTPKANLRIHALDSKWRYRAEATLDRASWEVGFDRLLQPFPNLFALPSFGESRSFTFSLEDGRFSFVEVAV